MVLMASLALAFRWPQVLFAAWPATVVGDLQAFGWVLVFYNLLHLPFDYVGGYWLPCHFSRQCLLFSYFFSQYLRGILAQSAMLTLSGMTVLAAGRWGGRWAALAVVAVLMLAMVEGQEWLAKFVAGLRKTREADANGRRVVYLSGWDAGFSGGVTGLPGRERLVLPSLWERALPKEAVSVELTRRMAALETGSRLRGLALAMAWNLSGFWASSHLPGAGVSTVAELFTTSLGFTLWSFVGLLLLPTASRLGVYEVDYFARQNGVPVEKFAQVAHEIDQLQDDEPVRGPGVESIFYPVPSVERRVKRFTDRAEAKGAWNAARYALFLSWPCMGWLNRAVHCNSGRPELWVMLPTD